MICQIIYELKNRNRDYDSFFKAIKKLGSPDNVIHYMANSWFVDSDRDFDEMVKSLLNEVSEGDNIVIVRLGGQVEFRGFLPLDAADWVKKKVKDGRFGPHTESV